MRKALHPRDDIDWLYVSRKGGERGLANSEERFDASVQWLEDYIQMREGKLIIATRNNTDVRNNRTTITRKQNGKQNSTDVLSDL